MLNFTRNNRLYIIHPQWYEYDDLLFNTFLEASKYVCRCCGNSR